MRRTHKEIIRFFNQLYVYTSISMPLMDAISILRQKYAHTSIYVYIKHIEEHLKMGQSVHSSFSVLYKEKVIDSVCWSILSVSDNSGDMSLVFKSISEYMKEKQRAGYVLVSSLMYPMGMICLSGITIILLVIFVFPKITPLFRSMNTELPPLTSFLISMSTFLTEYGLIIFICSIAIVLSAVYWLHTDYSIRKRFHIMLLRIPVLSNMLVYQSLYSISYTSSVLLKNNRPITDTLDIVSTYIPLIPLQESVRDAVVQIKKGKSVSSVFEASAYVDDEWIQCIQLGEKTGTLTTMFNDISKIYKDKYSDIIHVITKIAEPVALCVTAGMVLLIALSVIQPMYSVLQIIQK